MAASPSPSDSSAAAALFWAGCKWSILLNVIGMSRNQPGLPGGCYRQMVSERLRTIAKTAGLDRFSMHSDSAKNRYRRFQRARAGFQFFAAKPVQGVHMICESKLACSIGGIGCVR
jgi:hypothetical protein